MSPDLSHLFWHNIPHGRPVIVCLPSNEDVTRQQNDLNMSICGCWMSNKLPTFSKVNMFIVRCRWQSQRVIARSRKRGSGRGRRQSLQQTLEHRKQETRLLSVRSSCLERCSCEGSPIPSICCDPQSCLVPHRTASCRVHHTGELLQAHPKGRANPAAWKHSAAGRDTPMERCQREKHLQASCQRK